MKMPASRSALQKGRLPHTGSIAPLWQDGHGDAILAGHRHGAGQGRPCSTSSSRPSTRSSTATAGWAGSSSACSWHWELLGQPLLYLSLFFKRHRAEYYRRLNAVRVDGDWEGWLDFFLEGVEQTAEGAVQTARRLVDLFQQDHAARAGKRWAQRQHAARARHVATAALVQPAAGWCQSGDQAFRRRARRCWRSSTWGLRANSRDSEGIGCSCMTLI